MIMFGRGRGGGALMTPEKECVSPYKKECVSSYKGTNLPLFLSLSLSLPAISPNTDGYPNRSGPHLYDFI